MSFEMKNSERMSELAAYNEAVAPFRIDGYRNMLNKVGTMQDNSQTWEWQVTSRDADVKLASIYQTNGLFGKIIDRPSEDAMSKGLDLSDLGDDIEKQVKRKFQKLKVSEKLVQAEKWSRLFGGSIAILIVNDGGGLEDPLNLKKLESIEEIRVFERAVVQPDYSTIVDFSVLNDDMLASVDIPWGQPIYYIVTSIYGCFRVHYSRCLIFRNGEVPQLNAFGDYYYWGIPEYTRIKEALREAITSHHDGTKLLERSTLGVYKMKNLSTLLSTDEGEDKVIQRLQVIDEARNIINSMAIDVDGEDYQYINASMSGASDIIDRTCNMLSAVTDIPQTILFGKSPSGMDATGKSDMDNYFSLISRIQGKAYKGPLEMLLRMVLIEFVKGGMAEKDIPEYELRFVPMEELSEKEQADVDAVKAGIEKTKADTANVYVSMQALDPSEIRRGLSEAGEYSLQGMVDEDDISIPKEAFDLRKQYAELDKISNPQEEPLDDTGDVPLENSEQGIANQDGRDMMNLDINKYHDKRGRFASRGNSAAGAWDRASVLKVKEVDRETFSKALNEAKNSMDERKQWRVDGQSPEDLKANHPNAKLYVTERGSTFAVDNGDIIAVCVGPVKEGQERDKGLDLMKTAVANGGTKLDSYSGNYGFYTKCGFKADSWCKFDEQYAPPGWDKKQDDPEDIVMMHFANEPYSDKKGFKKFTSKVKASEDYDSAMGTRDEKMKGNIK